MNSMDVVNEAKVDCILAQAHIFIPDSFLKLLGAVLVGFSQLMLYGQRGSVAPQDGSNNRVRIKLDSCQESCSCLSRNYVCG